MDNGFRWDESKSLGWRETFQATEITILYIFVVVVCELICCNRFLLNPSMREYV